MYKSQLDTLLAQNAPRASLLYGDSFLVGYYSQMIADGLKNEEKMTFYFDEYNFVTINTLLSQNSLFGSSSLVVIKTIDRLKKSDIEQFLESLSRNTQNALIVEYYQSTSKSNAEYMRECKTFSAYFSHKHLKSNELVQTRFFEPNASERMGFMRQRCEELGLNADDKVLSYILELYNDNVALALNELEKFVIFKEHVINTNDVSRICNGVASFSIEELCVQLMEKKPILTMLQSIYDEGINEMAMISEIERFFYQLFLFYAFVRLKGRADAKEILGFAPPTHIVERLSRYCMRFKEAQYAEIFEALSYWRFEVSKGKSKQNFTTLIKIQEMIL